MAMLMMMMTAAKGNQGQTQAPFALSDKVYPPPTNERESTPVMEPKEETSSAQLPDFAELIMSHVSTLLDQKLMPIVSKLEKVEETLARLVRQLAPGQENDSNEDDGLVVMSTKEGIDAGLESDLLALRGAIRSSY